MSSDRDTTRIVRSWLEEGVTALPDRVLDGVLDLLPATRQRRTWWPSRRIRLRDSHGVLPAMASIAMVILVGLAILPSLAPGGGPAPPTPSPTQARPSPSPTEPDETSFPPGTYSLEGFPVGVSFTVPAGWRWCIANQFEQGPCRERGNGAVQFVSVENVVADPCGDALLDPPVGPSVDDLVAALSALSRFTATAPLDITVDGFAGKEFTLTAPDIADCSLLTWATPERINGVSGGEANLLRIVDVDGTRVVMAGPYPRLAADADEAIAAIKQVMDSVTFAP